MKALTIQQPYSHLIMHHQSELPSSVVQKRVENRSRWTNIRGPIAIHAGKSLKWFEFGDWPEIPRKPSDIEGMAFGSIVGVASIVDCMDGSCKEGRQWIATHDHAVGPYLWILGDVFRLETPVPCKGALGFWKVPEEIERQVNASRKIEVPFYRQICD